MLNMTNIENSSLAVPACIAAVKALRDTFPKIDGLLVLAASCAVGAGLSYLFTDAESIKQVVGQGLLWGFTGSGFMVVADRIAGSTPAAK